MAVAQEHGFKSIAFPLIGAGSGSFNQERAKEIMLDELQILDSPLEVFSIFAGGETDVVPVAVRHPIEPFVLDHVGRL